MQLPGDTGRKTMQFLPIDPATAAAHRRALELEAMPTLARAVFESSENAKKTGERVREAIDGLLGGINEAGAPSAPLPEASPATKGQCNDERACGACFSDQGSCVHASDCAQHNEPAMPAAEPPRAGCMVRLKSGGPDMKVESIYGESACCSWLDEKLALQSAVFPVSGLILIHPAADAVSAHTKPNRFRIEGDGTSARTRIVNATTGETLRFVRSYRVEQRVGEVAKAVIEVALPQVSLECDAEVREVNPSTNLTPTDVRWAEDLIRQLPADHDGRNSWLLNYGTDKAERQAEWARRNPQSSLAKNIAAAPELRPAADAQGQ